MRRAAKKDANHNDLARVMEQAGALVVDTSRLGAGFPDALIGYRGQTGLVEFKTKGGKLTDDQIKFWDKWTGGPIAQVRDAEGALRFLKMLEKACD